MKQFLILILLTTILVSCEKVIDVEVPNLETRLVIDASIDWEKETDGAEQIIRLTTTTPFFEQQQINPVNNAVVSIKNTRTNQESTFSNIGDGQYKTTTFVPVLNDEYELNILYNEEIYKAKERLMPTTPITRVKQGEALNFAGELEKNVEIYTNDTPNTPNFYFLKFFVNDDGPHFSVRRDRFQDGNEIPFLFRSSFYDIDNLETGDKLKVEYSGTSEQFYNFMFIVLNQTDQSGPFSPNPVQINGNGVNETNPEKKPLGYFKLSEIEKRIILIE